LFQQLPHEIIATGDSAYLMLSLVCRWFRDVVTNEIFQKAAHFAWLDSKMFFSVQCTFLGLKFVVCDI